MCEGGHGGGDEGTADEGEGKWREGRRGARTGLCLRPVLLGPGGRAGREELATEDV